MKTVCIGVVLTALLVSTLAMPRYHAGAAGRNQVELKSAILQYLLDGMLNGECCKILAINLQAKL